LVGNIGTALGSALDPITVFTGGFHTNLSVSADLDIAWDDIRATKDKVLNLEIILFVRAV
jgi:hypothetical protein